ncbi:hypothetical protein PAP_09145 [Palaeococcus pacificus DY20341]|uniref:Uncharacterized protein n=1 Tax=Palaeococcus pacificus DY20341 TaxID=1343739 RepID=A0A075LW15_9EURY|nr:hypothetical protein [Palaeococcus pacificus]AIF70207.1 hypothetical protein PAP_09145 [Palaeococcus pacificus DY20341]
MKRLVSLFLLLLVLPALMANFVSADSHFETFLKDGSSYTIVAGNSSSSKLWAFYIDEELKELKSHGKGKIILVGTVYDNDELKKVWRQTGLPPEKSKEFNVLFVGNYILITGDAESLPNVEELFVGNYYLKSAEFSMFLILAVFTFLLFFYAMRKTPYARSLYFLSSLILLLWVLNGYREFSFSEGFFKRYFFEALKLNFGYISKEPLSYPLFLWGNVFGFTRFSAFLLHTYLILLIISFTFYLVPKPSRELGFLIFGLMFVIPLFRAEIKAFGPEIFALLLFEVILAVGTNFYFVPNKGIAMLEVAIFSTLTSLSAILTPTSLVVPISFVTVYPKRYKRNYLYIASTLVLYLVLLKFFGVRMMDYFLKRESWNALATFAKESIVQFVVLGYACIELKNKRRVVGQTWFVGMAAFLYLLIFIAFDVSPLPLVLLLSTFVVRLTQRLP